MNFGLWYTWKIWLLLLEHIALYIIFSWHIYHIIRYMMRVVTEPLNQSAHNQNLYFALFHSRSTYIILCIVLCRRLWGLCHRVALDANNPHTANYALCQSLSWSFGNTNVIFVTKYTTFYVIILWPDYTIQCCNFSIVFVEYIKINPSTVLNVCLRKPTHVMYVRLRNTKICIIFWEDYHFWI